MQRYLLVSPAVTLKTSIVVYSMDIIYSETCTSEFSSRHYVNWHFELSGAKK